MCVEWTCYLILSIFPLKELAWDEDLGVVELSKVPKPRLELMLQLIILRAYPSGIQQEIKDIEQEVIEEKEKDFDS